MDAPFAKLIEPAKQVALTPAEKAALLRHLTLYLTARPIPAWPLPYDSLFRFHWRFAIPTFLLLLVVISSLTTFAAERSLPGDTLYPIKVNINEGVRELLTFDTAAKAEFEVTRVAARLAEAEQLAARGKLDEKAKKAVEARLVEHAARMEERVAELDLSGQRQAVTEVIEGLDTLLKTHRETLAALAAKDQGFKENLTALVETVEAIGGSIKAAATSTTAESSFLPPSAPTSTMENQLKEEATSTLSSEDGTATTTASTS